MEDFNLRYFTHSIDGQIYGGWYRVLSGNELEVLAVGILETARFGGFAPEMTARSVLEEFVRGRMRSGKPVPALGGEKISTNIEQMTGV